ncbi:MAG: hypothetical protein LBV72_14710 [Tannerella sp.]|jgi:hypothetical protein|nr:hypothetical protein [Tannerella sp.]
MQSLRRAIKRGNAVIAFNHVTKRNEPVWRKGTELKQWKYALQNAVVTGRNIDEYDK